MIMEKHPGKKDVKKAPAPKAAPKAETKAAKTAPKVTVNKDGAKDGDKVLVHYTGTFSDGKVFDSSAGREPLPFTLGAHQVVPGFENAVRGMKAGEKKKVTIPSKEAYGDHNPKLIQEVPIDAVKASGITPQKGMVLGLTHPMQPGQQIPAMIVDVTETAVKLDLNHPLAGKDLTFEVELIKID